MTLAAPPARPASTLAASVRPVAGFLMVLLALVVGWELIKWFAGDPWRYPSFLGTGIAIEHTPPFHLNQASDINLPHVWDVIAAFAAVDAAGHSGFESLVGAALFTLRGALVGFALGAAFGMALAILLVHVRILERALVPLVVASQTIPIVALAPIIVVGLQAGWFGIAIVASYLTFFPVTIAAIRGLRSADPRAIELMRSYAADRRSILKNVRIPAAYPYLFTAFKVSATASIVGAIVGELPSGFREGLGGSILLGMQYYTLSPADLWATVIVAAGLGMVAFLAVVVAERLTLRNQRPVGTLGA
ncbi:MAG TPA: ABC transporter permease subunit [Candidatus Eisenbacteria bacterium]|nr:ABC transporter permease subunit [Candidatus Eisenbacteria bacterium]